MPLLGAEPVGAPTKTPGRVYRPIFTVFRFPKTEIAAVTGVTAPPLLEAYKSF